MACSPAGHLIYININVSIPGYMDTFRFRSCWRQRRNTINHHHQTSLAYALNKCYSFMAISLIADDAFIQYYHCLNMVVQDCLKCGLGGIYYRCTIMRTLSIQLYTAVYKTWHNTLDNRDHECLYGRKATEHTFDGLNDNENSIRELRKAVNCRSRKKNDPNTNMMAIWWKDRQVALFPMDSRRSMR
ncbi:hypothetical protein BLOT_015546 [Blomia tropicalis]|nr:hypothetical protein BLOT_015546 [Blomia tropicalis]